MSALAYYFVIFPTIWWISKLPFSLLYLTSNVFYFWLHTVFGYRKKVVLKNLKNAFPDKSDKEINAICSKFYSYLCDLILETIKTYSISEKAVKKRVRFHDKALFERLHKENTSFIGALGHYGNWEWGGALMGCDSPIDLFVIFKPLKNKKIDKLLYNMRARLGTTLIPKKQAIDMAMDTANKDDGSTNAIAFITDQSPRKNKYAHWITFLNQDTAIPTGIDSVAHQSNMPVVFVYLKRPKRGYYVVHTEVITENPREMSEYEISEIFYKRLEQLIIEEPELWVWSHKRWKLKKEA